LSLYNLGYPRHLGRLAPGHLAGGLRHGAFLVLRWPSHGESHLFGLPGPLGPGGGCGGAAKSASAIGLGMTMNFMAGIHGTEMVPSGYVKIAIENDHL